MLETYIRSIADANPGIVERIEKLEISEEDQTSKVKAKLVLFDGTFLWIREVWIKETVAAYSYYWLRPDDSIIMGWDNAPHHRDVTSFPHHRHIGNNIELSDESDIQKVIEYIRNFLH